MDRAELARCLGSESQVNEATADPVVVEASDQGAFMAEFARAVVGGGPVFLADPTWGEKERKRLAELISDVGLGLASEPAGTLRESVTRNQTRRGREVRPYAKNLKGWLCIPSGGTSGALKFARHDEETIGAAVRGFCTHFGWERVNALGLLPLHHVSGLMAWMRCALSGGRYLPGDWKRLAAGERPAISSAETWVLSLVPTQLQRLLESPEAVAWLRSFRVIFVGGGPVWPELADTAARAGLSISLSYGMTETAAMVTALLPEEFRAGARSSGRALPHARVAISSEGLVRIAGDSLFRGYWPEERKPDDFETADLGRIDEQGQLHVLGRSDAMIITGGKKVSPAEVELALRATGEFSDVAVIGLPDAEWGEAVVACYPLGGEAPNLEQLQLIAQLKGLAAYKWPKRFVAVANWPRNAQGKVNRAELKRLAARSR
jgi:O-succinylbenzoic acid--CoA ligase